MVTTTWIASLIRENKTFRSSAEWQTSAALRIILMDTKLLSLVSRERVSPDEAVEKAQDPIAMREKLLGMGSKLRDL